MGKSVAYSYVRFSTVEQAQGDSLRRQTEAAEQYAAANNLILDHSLKLRDLGRSAHRGEHRTKGALKIFLDAVDDGTVKAGSFLLVENVDRLSREDVVTAQVNFLGLVQQGIKIVTLTDQRLFDKETLTKEPSNLYVLIGSIQRAHEESALKSQRISQAWEQKRKNIHNRPLTRKCPLWLRFDEGDETFVEIPERAVIVRDIFEMHCNGHGRRSIACHLNDNGLDPWGPVRRLGRAEGTARVWRDSYIRKILGSKAVIGEFQPHKLVDKKQIPVGDPIPDYFPQIIPEDIFYKAQGINEERNHNPTPGKLAGVSNLFTKIARCGYCESSMTVMDKGQPPKGRKYFICSSYRVKSNNCKVSYFHYDVFEEAMLDHCYTLNFENVLPTLQQSALLQEVSGLKMQLTTVQGKIKEASTQIDNAVLAITKTSSSEVHEQIETTMLRLIDQRKEMSEIEKKLKREIKSNEAIQESTEHRIAALQHLKEMMASKMGEELRELRLQMRTYIAGLVERIEFYPRGIKAPSEVIEHAERNGDTLIRNMLDAKVFADQDVADIKNKILERLKGDGRVIAEIKFKSGFRNRIAQRQDGTGKFILRAHNDWQAKSSVPFLNFSDTGSRGYWSAIQDEFGPDLVVALTAEISNWENDNWKPYEED